MSFGMWADPTQRRRYHRPALRFPQRWPHNWDRSPHRPHNNCRLDHSAHCHKFQAQRHRLVSGDGSTLLWQVGPGSYITRAMAVVRANRITFASDGANGGSAFGGMVAFCVIVGDTIPRVLDALFPSLSDMNFLWLLTNRRAIIILFILGVSYPLSLYRDIAKAKTPQPDAPL